MERIDSNGLRLCDLQAELFEESLSLSCGSEIFIRRFMNSKMSIIFDSNAILDDTTTTSDMIEEINKEYGASEYGTIKYTKDEIYWIGYLYRYFCYTYKLNSRQVYKIIKPKELRALYEPYHTMSIPTAIDRIMEAKGIDLGKDSYTSKALKIIRKRDYKAETFEMNLFESPFEAIKNGTKTIEMRLNDEKRRRIRPGDVIVFSKINSKEKITVKVKSIHKYKSFDTLYQHFDKVALGYGENEMPSPKDMLAYYGEEDIKKYGVLAIEIKLVRYNHNEICNN